MTKKLVWDEESVDFEGRLTWLREYVENLIEKYGESAYVEIESDYENTDYVVKYEREETEKEYTKRLKEEEKQKAAQLLQQQKKEEKERKEFERLKKKFGEI